MIAPTGEKNAQNWNPQLVQMQHCKTLGNPDPAASYTTGDKRYFKNSLFHNPML
jgi:hypothetical protein